MIGIPMNYEAYARKLGLPMIISADKKHPAGLFSPEIFGVTEDERNTKAALINLNCNVMRPIVLDMMKRVNRTIVKCVTTKLECYIRKGRIYEVKPDYSEEPGDVRGYGPTFLYNNWNSLDKKQFEQQTGRFSNIQVKRTIGMLSRENVFQHFVYVIPIGFREEEQDTIMVVNDINILYGDIIRYSRILAQPVQGVNNTDIEVVLQAKVLEFGEYIQGRFLGPHGVARKKIMSKPIDNSARMVILPNYYKGKELGKSDIGIGCIGIPLHHLISIFRDSIIKFSLDFITALHSQGYFPEGTTSDMLPFYDVEYLTERIAKMEDIYQRTVSFPAIKPDGTFASIILPFEVYNNGTWETVNKELTWAEFFYIVAVGYLDVYHTRYTAATRYPIDSILSQQYLKPKPITISPNLTKHVKVFGFDFEEFPLIDENIRTNFQEKVWEQAARMNSAVTEAMSGDHDGDSISIKGINSKEAVEECNRINDNLLEIFDYAGNFRRGVGKDPVQTVWTFTRDPKPNERPKKINSNHPFIQYLDKLKNGNLDTECLYSYTLSFDSKKGPDINLYDKVDIKRFGKTIETTVGRYVYNKTVYHLLWDNKYFPYINEVVTKDGIEDIFKFISQLEVEKKCEKSIIRRTIDMNTEFGLRLSTMYNAGLTDSMLLPDDEFMNFRDEKIKAVQKQVEETGDIELLSKAENEVIDYAKKHFKDDDMYEMYASGAKASWTNDFKNLQVNLGALPKITGGKPTIIFNSLTQGVDAKYIPDYANTGFKSATDRGLTNLCKGHNTNTNTCVVL